MSRCAGALAAFLLAAVFPTAASAASHVVEINGMKFGAVPKNLKVGDEVTWKNNDILSHTATARDGAFDLRLPPGANGTITLKRAGRMSIFCRYHPDMVLELVIGR